MTTDDHKVVSNGRIYGEWSLDTSFERKFYFWLRYDNLNDQIRCSDKKIMPYESWAIVFHVVCSKCNPIFMILVLKCYQNRNLWQIDIAEFSEIGLERPLMTTRWSCMIEYTESSHKTYQLKGNLILYSGLIISIDFLVMNDLWVMV